MKKIFRMPTPVKITVELPALQMPLLMELFLLLNQQKKKLNLL